MIVTQDPKNIKTVVLDDCRNTIEEFVAVCRYHARVTFSDEYRKRVVDSRASLEKAIENNVGIYGVNTGFGDNVRYRITEDEMDKLQENILRNHGCAVGDALSEETVRALMLMQLMNIGKGYSAVRLEVLEQIRLFLNEDVCPYVPSEGTVGGLTFQPYAALTYFGEGRVISEGKIIPAIELLRKKGITPLKVKVREGLSLLSTASNSIGTGLLAVYDFIMALRHSDICAALVCEALRSTDKAYNPKLIELKNHKDTTDSAELLRWMLKDSEIMEKARNERVQDSMATRIIPHVYGAAKRITRQTYEVLMEELQAVFDNPVFFGDGTALMGSNWDATSIALYCDALTIGVMNMAKLVEVQMERLVDPNLSGLPAFLVENPGLNNGFMIPQYVTAGLLADIALLSTPAAAFNAAVSAGQESPIYRDDTAARKLYTAVKKYRHILAITMMTALQAIDMRHDGKMSSVTQAVHDKARETVSFMANDDIMYERIEAMEELLESNELLTLADIPFTI